MDFLPTPSAQLYAAAGGDVWVAYYLPTAPAKPPASISLTDAFAGVFGLGTFVFSAAPGLDVAKNANAIGAGVQAALDGPFTGNRAIAWLTDPTAPNLNTIALLGFSANGNTGFVGPGLQATLVPNNLQFNMSSGVQLALNGDVLTLTSQGTSLSFFGTGAPLNATQISSATIAFSGPAAGTIQFSNYAAQRSDLHDRMRWGFQLLCNGPATTTISQQYPLADGSSPSADDMIGFNVSIDPSDPTNDRLPDRTYLAFTGTLADGTTRAKLASGYRTVFGDIVNLYPIGQPGADELPARLVLALGNPNTSNPPDFAFGPEGDFILNLDAPKDGISSMLLCGLSATETLTFKAGPASDLAAGDRLRFTSRCDAFAVTYPPAQANTLGIPIDPTRSPMSSAFHTAWATLVNAPANTGSHYTAQPHGSALFGFDDVISTKNAGLLGNVDPGYLLTAPPPFPLIPYALATVTPSKATFDSTALGGVEQFAVSPARRTTVGAPSNAQPNPPPRMSLHAQTANGLVPATTPSGLLAQIDQSTGILSQVILGVNYHATEAGPMWMVFDKPAPKLQQALQTSQVFVVAANATNLGAFATSPPAGTPPAPGGTPTFYNTMAIEDWQISANVGQHNAYGDYNNILIIKGCKGKLIDLVGKPDGWTQREDFSIPGTDASEIAVLSQWLADYVQTGIDNWTTGNNPYFANFANIAADPNWTGIIVLRASLTALPTNLGGLLSVMQPDQTFAHHFGVTISAVAAGGQAISIPHSSSMFELVYYVNPSFDVTQNPPQVLPPNATPYDFQLLTLKALFENTAVKAFESLAQLTLAAFFGDPVAHMQPSGNTYDTIFLQGVYQRHGDIGTFLLDSLDDNLFYMNSNVINKVEIVKAQFNTLDPTTLRFDLWGYLDFAVLQGGNAPDTFPFDAFGFGSTNDLTATRTGLSFANLGIVIHTGTNPAAALFDVGAMTFDPTTPNSTPRPGSLYQAFALQLQGLLTGDDANDPSTQNYQTLATNAALSGVSGMPWYALSFQLKMGTAGALAGKLGLNAGLIVAWAPGAAADDTSYNAMVGLQLPGVAAKTNLLSLQGILSLSIGTMRLTYDVQQGQPPGSTRYWVLWLTEIALKFLGLVKIPPNGATSFACFGNPDANGSPTAVGWYAVYNQDKQDKKALVAAGEESS